jgi:hypothetical protein
MREGDKTWMAYIDGEVRAACNEKGWGYQIRRKWSVREKPVSESSLDDYEWKLIPGARSKLPDPPPTDLDEGTYYVLRVDRGGGKFVLQHDNYLGGCHGPHWHMRSYTEIHIVGSDREHLHSELSEELQQILMNPPADGWLREFLIELTSRFGPNHFSIT